LRGNETQEKILYELEMLKSSIKQSVQAAFRHGDGFSHIMGDPSDARAAYNLQNLARAAQNFHSSASSTASTIHGANGTSFWNLQSDAAMSVRGGPNLTPNKRQQIEGYIKQQRRMTQRAKRKPLQRIPSSAAASVVVPSIPDPEPAPAVASDETESTVSDMADDNDEQDEEAEFQSFLLSGLEEVAKDSMLNQEFAKAQSMLEEAIQRRTGSTSEEADFKQLQIQLAICYFFQHKWNLAEPLIDSIAKSKANFDPVVCNLLHALAIANLVEKRFEKAITVCMQALQGKRRLKRDFGDISETECNQTLGLLATIHDIHGNRLDAEALRRKLSKGFSYYHPENELEFIVNHPNLCTKVFGKKIALDWRRPQIPATNHGVVAELIADLPSKDFLAPIKADTEETTKNKTSKKPLQTFHTKLSLSERLNTDSAKEVVGSFSSSASTDDGISYADTIFRPSTRLGISPKRSFTRRITRFVGTLRRPSSSRDDWNTQRIPSTEGIPSPSRPRFGKGFWSMGDLSIFKLKKPKTKLRKRSSDQAVQSSFSILQQRRQEDFWKQTSSSNPPAYDGPPGGTPDLRPWRYSVDQWLRMNSWNPQNSAYHSPDDYLSSNCWVPASQILEEEEEQSRPPFAELADTSFERSVVARPPERKAPPQRLPPRAPSICHDRCDSTLAKDKEWGPSEVVSSRDKLKITIPTSRRPGGISLVAHNPAEVSQAPRTKTTDGAKERPAPSITDSSSPMPTTPNKTETIAKVLDDFKDDDTDELAVKERLERDFDEFMQEGSQGMLTGPAAYSLGLC
jgi:hypothetical protein